MNSAQSIISRFHRDLALSWFVRRALLFGAVAALFLGPALGGDSNGLLVLVGICVAWMMMGYRSVQESRTAAGSGPLIAAGEYDEAERRIVQTLHRFTLFSASKLISIHHLALLRHAQKRWVESASLSLALLNQRTAVVAGLDRSTRLLLIDASLEMNDLPAAYNAIGSLAGYRLTLDESLYMVLLQLDYLSRLGAWQFMLQQIAWKVQMAELMPPARSARTQAFLSLAASSIGQRDMADWLGRRAALLCDPDKIVESHPVLKTWVVPSKK